MGEHRTVARLTGMASPAIHDVLPFAAMPVLADLRSLPRSAWILFAGTFVNRFGSFVHPFLVLYLTSRGHSAAIAGLAMGAYGAGHFLAAFVGGWLADRIGRRRSIAISMFGSAGAMLALSTADTLQAIIPLATIAGMFGELYRPAASALLTDLTPPGKRVIAFGAYRFAVNVGFALGPATAGFLATKSFTWLFVGDAITSAVYGIIALATLPDGNRDATGNRGWAPALRHALANPPFLRVLAASVIASSLFFQFESTLPLHVVDSGFSPRLYGALISLNGMLIILFELPIAGFSQRFAAPRAMAVGFLFTGIGFGLTGHATTTLLLALHTVVWTIGEMTFAPVAAGYVADLAPENLRGRYMGLWQISWAIGLTVGPAGGAWLYSVSPPALWATCFVAGILAALVIAAGRDGRTGATTDTTAV